MSEQKLDILIDKDGIPLIDLTPPQPEPEYTGLFTIFIDWLRGE